MAKFAQLFVKLRVMGGALLAQGKALFELLAELFSVLHQASSGQRLSVRVIGAGAWGVSSAS